MADAPNIPIATIDKNRGSEVRVALTEFKGQRLVDLRVYCGFTAANVPMPTKRGIALSVGNLPELVAALRAAEARARELGFLS